MSQVVSFAIGFEDDDDLAGIFSMLCLSMWFASASNSAASSEIDLETDNSAF